MSGQPTPSHDSRKALVLWAAIRFLEDLNQRERGLFDETFHLDALSWHEHEALQLLFLRHRYIRGELGGPTDR